MSSLRERAFLCLLSQTAESPEVYPFGLEGRWRSEMTLSQGLDEVRDALVASGVPPEGASDLAEMVQAGGGGFVLAHPGMDEKKAALVSRILRIAPDLGAVADEVAELVLVGESLVENGVISPDDRSAFHAEYLELREGGESPSDALFLAEEKMAAPDEELKEELFPVFPFPSPPTPGSRSPWRIG